MQSPVANIGIAGAGIMGRVLAWQLQQAGYAVSLFDRDAPEHGSAAAYTAAGMLAPYSELESAEGEIYALGRRSLTLWPALVNVLGAEDCLHRGGSIVVAHGQDAADLTHFNQLLKRKAPDCSQNRFLTRAELAELEPELADQFPAATYLAEESWLYTHELMASLARKLLAGGAQWFPKTEVSALAPGVIQCSDNTYTFDRVIDCRGLGAKGDIPGLRGVRGEIIEVHAPDVHLSHMVRLMHPRYRLYLVPRQHNHYILGATQIESEDVSEISVRSALELLSALYAISPAFGEARIVATRTNARPALMDNLPLVSEIGGVLRINGLYRHGYLLAPALAEQALDIIANSLRGTGHAI